MQRRTFLQLIGAAGLTIALPTAHAAADLEPAPLETGPYFLMRFDNRILRMRSIFTNVRRAVAQDVYETYGVPDGDHTWLKIIGREGLANPDGETVYLPYGGSIMRYYAKTVIECMDGKAIRVRKHHGAGLLTQTKDSLPPFPGEMNTKAVALLMPVNNLFKACADDDEPEPGEVVVV